MTTSTATGLEQLTGTYDIDASHSSLEFAAKHAMVTTVRGRFSDFSGVLHLDGADPEASRAEVTINVGSLDSRSDQRDEHLRGADFFDVEKYPRITFKSTRAARGKDDDEYRLWGDLTIKGVTREVELVLTFTGSAQDPWGGQRVGFEGHATVNRKDWGLTWNVALEAGGILVSDKVKLNLDIAAVKRAG
ncbi:MAG TPA: YceI family protein [Mycobacteriales bacterium]|jgi:polyisoprenoid-binding protein YceI|nr:YceI family protein [Mycobacteriales bacterium]